MRGRCDNRNNHAWNRYGGRGITVCKHLHVFTNFFALMGTRPSDKHSIDRINNDGNYSCGTCSQCLKNGWPLNVQWATDKEQVSNRSNSRLLAIGGVTMTAGAWANLRGIPRCTIMGQTRKGTHARAGC